MPPGDGGAQPVAIEKVATVHKKADRRLIRSATRPQNRAPSMVPSPPASRITALWPKLRPQGTAMIDRMNPTTKKSNSMVLLTTAAPTSRGWRRLRGGLLDGGDGGAARACPH